MSDQKIAIICVLKSGGDFSFLDVVKLKTMLEKNVTVPYTFYCLTNTNSPTVFKLLPLLSNYRGWWSKIELFKPNLVKEHRIVYFDLDTVIVSNIDDLLLQDHDFIGLKPFNLRRSLIDGYIASGIMSWRNDGTFNYIFNKFKYLYDSRKYAGDQDYISYMLQKREIIPMYWQSLVDGIYSYKRHLKGKVGSVKFNPRVVCFHGLPRPHQVNVNWSEI